MSSRSLGWGDRYLVLLAAAPLWWLVVDVSLATAGGVEALQASTVAAALVTTPLVLLDSAMLARRGVRVSAWWGLLLVFLYLVVRTRRARSTWALPVAAAVLGVGYLLGSAPVLTSVLQGT